MSSTTGIQNLLVNVFRPVYTYDATTTLYTPKLDMSNIDTYLGNTVSVFTAAVGDANRNVYVGSNAGNPYTTLQSCSNVTAIGFNAGSSISNVSDAVYVGYSAGANIQDASNVVAIGSGAIGGGISNVYIGTNTGSAGDSNIYIGTSNTGSGSNNILIGQGISVGSSNSVFRLGSTYLYGDMSTKWLGLGRSAPIDSNSKFDVSGNVYVFGQQGINRSPERTLDVNGDFRASDSNGTLDFFGGVTSSSNGFASVRGTTTVSGGVTAIGTIKKGIIMVSAVDSGSSANRAARMFLAYTTSNVTEIGSNIAAGNTSITTSSTNIQLTDATNATYTWSITYFPLA